MIELLCELLRAMYQVMYIGLALAVAVGCYIKAGEILPEKRTEGYYYAILSTCAFLSVVRLFFGTAANYVPEMMGYNIAQLMHWYAFKIPVFSVLRDNWVEWIQHEEPSYSHN